MARVFYGRSVVTVLVRDGGVWLVLLFHPVDVTYVTLAKVLSISCGFTCLGRVVRS